MPFLPPRVKGTVVVKDEPPLPTVVPPTVIKPFVGGAAVTRHHTATGSAIVEQHVEQTVVHETHLDKQIMHERHIDQPVIHERHIDQPVIHERHYEQPVIHERHYEQPIIHERHIEKPVIHERHIEQPIIHEKHIERPIIHERHIEKPVIHEKHIVKPVVHEVHINQPVFHERVVAPARVEVYNRTEQAIIDHQYTTAAPIVMNEYGQLPAQITVEHSVAPPIIASSTLTAHSPIVQGGSPTALTAPRSPTWMSGPRSPSSMSSCSSYSPSHIALMSPRVVPAPGYGAVGGCQEVIVVDEPPTKFGRPAKVEKHSHRLSLRQRLDQKLHRHH